MSGLNNDCIRLFSSKNTTEPEQKAEIKDLDRYLIPQIIGSNVQTVRIWLLGGRLCDG